MRASFSVFLASIAIPVYGQNEWLTFQGTATVVMDKYQYDPFSGQDYFVAQVQEQFATDVFIQNPRSTLEDFPMTEKNPFALSIFCDRLFAEGSTTMVSALVHSTPDTGRPYLAQYWTYDYDLNDGWLEGTLTDTHYRESIAINMIKVQDPFVNMVLPRAIADGASIQGYVFPEWVHLILNGTTTDTYTHFTMEVQASVTNRSQGAASLSLASGSPAVPAPTGSNASQAVASGAFAAHRMAALLFCALAHVVVSVSI